MISVGLGLGRKEVSEFTGLASLVKAVQNWPVTTAWLLGYGSQCQAPLPDCG